MKILISPSKTLSFDSEVNCEFKSECRLIDETKILHKILLNYSSEDLKNLMSVSDKIAELNYNRFKNWEDPNSSQNSRQAADVVITTAQVFGSKSPVLISKAIVEKMKSGTVIVDLASSTGGNCELTQDSKIIDYKGVKIVGNSYLASELSHDASNLFSNNVFNFIDYVIKDNELINENDDILKSCKI